jgi:mycothiol system anti-sigma-R factor
LSPIDCQRVLRDLQVYLDGEIAGRDCDEIERHLGICGQCLERADFLRALKSILRERCGCDELPADLEARVRSALGEDAG